MTRYGVSWRACRQAAGGGRWAATARPAAAAGSEASRLRPTEAGYATERQLLTLEKLDCHQKQGCRSSARGIRLLQDECKNSARQSLTEIV